MEEEKMEKSEIQEEGVKESPRPSPAITVRINTKIVSSVVILLVIVGALFYYKGVFVVALVNGSPISRLSVVQELEKQSGKQALDSIITKKLITDEANKKGVTVSGDEINAEIKKISDQIGKQGGTLQTALAQQGMTEDRLREQITLQKKIEKIIADKLAVSDAEADKYIQDNKVTPTKDQKPDDLRAQVKEQLKQQKFSQEADQWITTLKDKAKIQYFVTY